MDIKATIHSAEETGYLVLLQHYLWEDKLHHKTKQGVGEKPFRCRPVGGLYRERATPMATGLSTYCPRSLGRLLQTRGKLLRCYCLSSCHIADCTGCCWAVVAWACALGLRLVARGVGCAFLGHADSIPVQYVHSPARTPLSILMVIYENHLACLQQPKTEWHVCGMHTGKDQDLSKRFLCIAPSGRLRLLPTGTGKS